MIVTHRLSPSMFSTEPDGDAGLESHAAPHAPQKRNPGGFSSPHAAHLLLNADPHWPQKRCAASLSSPQMGHGTFSAKADPYAYMSAEMRSTSTTTSAGMPARLAADTIGSGDGAS